LGSSDMADSPRILSRRAVIFAFLGTCALTGIPYLVLRFGNPQWHPLIYRFQTPRWSAQAERGIRPPEGYSGRWVDWLPNGEKVETTYVRGLRHGKRTIWWPDGIVATVETYRHDRLNGSTVAWHSNGQTAVVGTLVDGVPSGVWSRWNLDGDVTEVVEFRDGRETGKWASWTEYASQKSRQQSGTR